MLHKKIEDIRIGKGIPINKLVDGIFSRTTYHHFKTGTHDIKLNNFLGIAERLYLATDELALFIKVDASLIFKDYLFEIRKHISGKDFARIIKLQKKIQSESYYFSEHLYEIIEFALQRHKVTASYPEESKIMVHLIETELWTRYEIILFCNSMFIMTSDLINTLLHRVLKNLKHHKLLRHYGDEGFRVLVDAYFVFFERKNIKYMLKWRHYFLSYPLEDSFLFEKTFKKIVIYLMEYILDENSQALNQCQNIALSLREIDGFALSQSLIVMLHFIEENYSIES